MDAAARQVIRAMHDYSAWGLHVRSPFALPFMPLAQAARRGPSPSSPPDVTIHLGATPDSLATYEAGGHDAGGMTAGPTWQATRSAFLWNVDGVFRCLVVDGRKIVVEPCRGGSGLARYLVGLPFSAVLMQRGALAFHAGAIATKAGAVLFAGRRGAGKSSLLGKFVERGYTILSDDVVGVALDAGRPVALPAFPRLRLRVDALDRLGWWGRERGRICRDAKYEVPVEEWFHAGSLPIRAFCELQTHRRDDVEVEPAPEAAAFRRMRTRTYRASLEFCAGQRPRQFGILAVMGNGVPFAHVRRPAQPFLLDTLADEVERWLSGLEDVPDPPAGSPALA